MCRFRWRSARLPTSGNGAIRKRAECVQYFPCGRSAQTTYSDVEQVVSAISSDYAGFVVTEAMPKGRSTGFVSSIDPQPGLKVTSLLCRAPSLTHDKFLSHWYEVHMPMSLRIHPQWTYARNVITRTLTPGSPDSDAVCEEGFEHLNDVLDPQCFYGADGHTWVQNRSTIGDDVVKFLDRSRSLTSIMREYRLRDFRH